MSDKWTQEMYAAILERTIKRLWIVIIILIFLFTGTNGFWLYYESQFEDTVTTETVEQDVDTGDDSGDIVVNGIGDVNGESEAENNKNDQDKD